MAAAKKTAKTSKKTETAADLDVARKIWLAGVGAYGRMYSETQGAAERLAVSANEAFDQLVAKGEEVEDKVRDAIAKSPSGKKYVEMVETATSKARTFRAERRAELEERIGKVRKSVTEALAPVTEALAPYNPAALSQTMEKLSAQVEALTAEVATLKAAASAKAAKADAAA